MYRSKPQSTKPKKQLAVTAPATPASTSILNLEVLASHKNLPAVPNEQAYYVLLTPLPSDKLDSSRLPLNLCLLVDRSTSMRGERIHQVKQAINQIIDKLQTEDTLSLVTFSDRAEVVLSGQRDFDSARVRSIVSTITPSGGTEILPGLEASLEEINRHKNEASINHLILLTDGHTYGDEAKCLEKAEWAGQNNMQFSTIGLGYDWNEDFLDQLATLSGGTSLYIDRAENIGTIFDETVRNLEAAIARQMTLKLDLNNKVYLHEAHQITPQISRIDVKDNTAVLGLLSADQEKSILLEFRVKRLSAGEHRLMRLTVEADVPHQKKGRTWEWTDIAVQIVETPELNMSVPTPIKVSLKKLAVFKMQAQVNDDLKAGDVTRATQRLQIMATRLLDLGEPVLAQAALQEAKQLTYTGMLSPEGSKKIHYGTRKLSI